MDRHGLHSAMLLGDGPHRSTMRISHQICSTPKACQTYHRGCAILAVMLQLHGRQLSHLTDDELHAEICHAESLLLRAVCTFVEDESLMSFVRGTSSTRLI